MHKRIFFILVLLIIIPIQNSYSWSLKTHVWIGQQIINDLENDGKVSLLGSSHSVPNHVRSAILNKPQFFLMGCLGPDVFPDLIVGQTTTHPGVKNGWATDQWLGHLLKNASSEEEIAFAYGIACHIASDIFAHTYVNSYAGDVFTLTDDEREVEKRHFILEKYIESLTPSIANKNGVLDFNNGLKTPSSYITKNLILNKEVSKQYLKSGTGLHLFSMHEVRRGVKNFNVITSDIISQITEWAADYYKLQSDLIIDIASGEAALDVAIITLEGSEEALKVKEELHNLQIKGLNEAKQIIAKNPELISTYELQIIESTKIALDLSNEAIKFASKLEGFKADIENEIGKLANKLEKFACNRHTRSKHRKKCRRKVDEGKGKINALRNSLSIQQLKAKEYKNAAKKAEAHKNKLKKELERIKEDLQQAKTDISNKVFEAQIELLEKEIQIEKELIKDTKKIIKETKEEIEKLTDELDIINKLIDEIKKGIDKYNPVTLLITNWLDDIDNSVNEYVKTSGKVGKMMVQNQGSPLDEYWEWYKCYAGVFTANPQEIGDLKCEVEQFYNKLNSEYNKIYEELPEPLQWVINPAKKLTDEALEELKPELERAKFNLIEFLTDKTTAEFIELLSNPKNANKNELISTFKKDKSKKQLLTFQNVSDFIDQDLSIKDGYLDADKFLPIRHSLTLTKLAIMDAPSLNNLINIQLNENVSSYFGKEVYKSDLKNFSILLGAVSNIDGNHQWQTFGLPYPRKHGSSNRLIKFGHDYYKNKNLGFKIFVDPLLRERVFIPLFEGGIIGSLREKPELQWPKYLFPECNQNPFPITQDMHGNILKKDNSCDILDNSNEIFFLAFGSQDEFKKRYFQMDASVEGSRTWTLAGSYTNFNSANRAFNLITKTFPDIYCELWKPNPDPKVKNEYWTIMLSAGTNEARALEVKNLAIRRRISTDSYIWQPTYPWVKHTED